MKTPVIETGRLILRPPTLADAPSLQRHMNDWEIIKYLSKKVPWPYPPDASETFLRDVALPAVARGDIHLWALTLRANPDEAIGVIELRLKAEETGSRGFWLSRQYHGKGLMTEASAAVNRFAFGTLG